MSVSCNGSTGYLEWNKGGGSLPVTAFPFSIALRFRSPVSGNDQFLAGIQQSNADNWMEAYADGNGVTVYSAARFSGSSTNASATGTFTTMKLMIVTFTATATSVAYGSSTFNPGSAPAGNPLGTMDRIVIGARHWNGQPVDKFLNGDIAEVHFFNRELLAADFTTLNADYKPENLSGWQDGWALRDNTDLTSINGRTLTLVGGVTSTGSHPITRSSDVTPPVLSSPTGSATGSTTANVGATTDEGNGTMYAVVTTSATQPSIAQIKAGQNNGGTAAAYAGNQAISSTGAKNFSATGLTASTAYYAHFVHTDAAGNDSNRVTSVSFTTGAAGDTTPPNLTSPTGTQTGSTTATIGATTDEGNGTFYGVVSPSATPPTATQVMNGQTNAGVAAPYAGNVAVSSTGAKNLSATGLSPSTTYYAHLMHRDAAGNNSTVVTSASFTTAAAGTIVGDPIKSDSGVGQGSVVIPKVMFIRISDLAVVLTLTNQTVTAGTNLLSVTNAALVAGTAYLRVLCNSDGSLAGAKAYTAT